MKKLYRSRSESMISGVCGGLGHYLGVDPTIIRISFVILAFYHMLGFWVYLVMMLLLPMSPEGYEEKIEQPSAVDRTQTTKVIGWGMVAVGLIAMISSLDLRLFSWLRIANLWPVMLILFGIVLLVRVFNLED